MSLVYYFFGTRCTCIALIDLYIRMRTHAYTFLSCLGRITGYQPFYLRYTVQGLDFY